MDTIGINRQKNHVVYKVLTSIFAIASVIYVWVSVDWFLDFKASLDSSETVEIWGSEWPVSTIHGLVFGGWLVTAGPYAAGVLAAQFGSIWWFRPMRGWLATGVLVIVLCCFAIWNWLAN